MVLLALIERYGNMVRSNGIHILKIVQSTPWRSATSSDDKFLHKKDAISS
jgi:hypothetical protein